MMVTHANNLSTWEAKAEEGGSPEATLVNNTTFQARLGYLVLKYLIEPNQRID